MELLPGYNTKWGNKTVVVADVEGPDYYFTGGSEISIESLGLGLGAFDYVAFSVSESGTYRAEARYEDSAGNPVTGQATPTVKIVITLVSGGAEAAYGLDLGAEIFRMLAVCV